jgi:hypothetical protein
MKRAKKSFRSKTLAEFRELATELRLWLNHALLLASHRLAMRLRGRSPRSR